VWLDRGELDKIIERSAELESVPAPVERNARRPGYELDDDDYRYTYDRDREVPSHKKKRGFLGEMFDIFD
jgi:Zn-finger nucleic acid-binding protein